MNDLGEVLDSAMRKADGKPVVPFGHPKSGFRRKPDSYSRAPPPPCELCMELRRNAAKQGMATARLCSNCFSDMSSAVAEDRHLPNRIKALPFEPVSTTARGCEALRKALREAELEVALGDRRSARVRALETAAKLRQALDYVDDQQNAARLKRGMHAKHRENLPDNDSWSETGSEAWGGPVVAAEKLVGG